MGFASLRLVKPCDHLAPQSQWLAHGSTDILQTARVFGGLEEALGGVDYAVATTARRRHCRRDYHTPAQLLALLCNRTDVDRSVALVFGREDRGLLNDEVRRCDTTSSIPMVDAYPSLNLAQAVMVYAYALAPLALTTQQKQPAAPSPHGIRALRTTVADLLTRIGYRPGDNVHERIDERIGSLDGPTARLLHGVCAKLRDGLD